MRHLIHKIACGCFALLTLGSIVLFAAPPDDPGILKQEPVTDSKNPQPKPLVDFAEEFVRSMRELANSPATEQEQQQQAVELAKRFNAKLEPQTWTIPCTINHIRKADKPGRYLIEFDPPAELTGVAFHWRFRSLYTMPLAATEAKKYAPGDQIVFTGKPEFQTKQDPNYFFSISHEKQWDRAGFIKLESLEVKLQKVEK